MTRPRRSPWRLAAGLLPGIVLAGCEAGPKPIRYGRDECAECRMILVDPHYGAELITARGRVLKFDDISCLLTHTRRNPPVTAAPAKSLVVDFSRPNHFLAVDAAWFLLHPRLRSPMSSNVAAFADEAALAAVRQELEGGGHVSRWAGVQAALP